MNSVTNHSLDDIWGLNRTSKHGFGQPVQSKPNSDVFPPPTTISVLGVIFSRVQSPVQRGFYSFFVCFPFLVSSWWGFCWGFVWFFLASPHVCCKPCKYLSGQVLNSEVQCDLSCADDSDFSLSLVLPLPLCPMQV